MSAELRGQPIIAWFSPAVHQLDQLLSMLGLIQERQRESADRTAFLSTEILIHPNQALVHLK